jgi:hypothetical protein
VVPPWVRMQSSTEQGGANAPARCAQRHIPTACHVSPCLLQVLVHNVKDLEMLMMHNRVFCAEVRQQCHWHTLLCLGWLSRRGSTQTWSSG